jgi:membrane associated rhomboid family serine protease
MLYDRPYMRVPTEFRTSIPGWKLLVCAAAGLMCLNAVAIAWLGQRDILAYELPGSAALGHWRIWTMLTYALVENPFNWFWGPFSILFLWLVGRMVEAELPRAQFLALCAGCALAGSVLWLPLHWASGDALLTGCTVLVMGLLAYWCFTVPDEPVELRLFFVIPITARPQAIFWFFLALDAAGFLTIELPRVLGHDSQFLPGVDYSPFLGSMLAGRLSAWWLQRQAGRVSWGAVPQEETAPRRWLQKALQVSAWSGGGRQAEGGTARAAKAVVSGGKVNRRELREEVDRILDKINVEGFGALNEEERQTLDRAKEWLGK